VEPRWRRSLRDEVSAVKVDVERAQRAVAGNTRGGGGGASFCRRYATGRAGFLFAGGPSDPLSTPGLLTRGEGDLK
jgi:hypothetical protein